MYEIFFFIKLLLPIHRLLENVQNFCNIDLKINNKEPFYFQFDKIRYKISPTCLLSRKRNLQLF